MKIIYVTAEVTPFAKTGDLADVGAALPKALARLGHDVKVIMPRFRCVNDAGIKIEGPIERVTVPVDGIPTDAQIYRAALPGSDGRVTVEFIGNSSYFDRDGQYGEGGLDYTDNLERFVFFSRAVVRWLDRSRVHPDVIHSNDWHSALIPTYARTDTSEVFDHAKLIYTIHNLAYQGLFARSRYSVLGLPWDLFHLDALEFYDRINVSKGGIIFSDAITTVSPTFSEEMQTPEFGCGLDGLLSSVSLRLTGILNGCDTESWNPRTDSRIAATYDEASLLEGKRANKQALREAAGLDAAGDDVPVFGMVSLLEEMKGADVVAAAAESLVADGAQLVILGTGEGRPAKRLTDTAEGLKGKMSVRIGEDEDLTRLLFAGSDFYLMPSRSEPCGLSQMCALRYGTIPIVNAVGGLADSIVNLETSETDGTGLYMTGVSEPALLKACKKAIDLYANPDRRRAVAARGMVQDFSWDATARSYLKLYESLQG